MHRADHRCPRCGGNLFPRDEEDPGVWACLLCARTFRPAEQPGAAQPARSSPPRAA